jgi:hypothetical protein
MTAIRVCPVCKVQIVEDGEPPVKFSRGNPATYERLYARVCQYIQADPEKHAKCINKAYDPEKITENDYFRPL